MGDGSVTITKSEPEKGIEYNLAFGKEEPIKGTINFEPVEGGTKVIWIFDGDIGTALE